VDLGTFFLDEGIDVWSEVGIDVLSEADREAVVRFFPPARSVVIFGREVPVPVYRMQPGEKTREMLRIAEELDKTAVRLAGLLHSEQIPARSVPLYLPVRIADGRVHGVVPLKKVAEAGGLGSAGTNTVLLTPRFGPRLLLSGVVTGRQVMDSTQHEKVGVEGAPWACTRCGSCIRACPTGALGPEGVDAFRCRDMSAWVPPILVPLVIRLLGWQGLQKCIAPLAPWIAKRATIRCSFCVTECPKFAGSEKKAEPYH
jgi:epoxyqueuosine reductase QueG